METMNGSLQQEVLMLRSEVQQLKSILIAHKDCPLIVHHTKGMTTPTAFSDDSTMPLALSAQLCGFLDVIFLLKHMQQNIIIQCSYIDSGVLWLRIITCRGWRGR